MREVAAVAELGLPEAEAKAELEKRLISRFDPASILLSIAWIQGKLQDKEYGDEDAEA
jgi:hypothetical protein